MKVITTLFTMAALVSGVTIASAQNSSETRGPASNPNMSTGGAGTPANSMSNPLSPQPPATSGAANRTGQAV